MNSQNKEKLLHGLDEFIELLISFKKFFFIEPAKPDRQFDT